MRNSKISVLKSGAHIHLMGICGTAMASLAGILQSMGYHITGSDKNVYPPMSDQLADLGIPVMEGYNRSNLEPAPDFVVVGNVISKHFPEAEALFESNIPYTHLPKALGEIAIGRRNSLVVAGTHGKTTTTAMVAKALDTMGFEPGFLIGGIPLNFERSFRAPKGNWFAIEGDEYDSAFFDKVPKFIHYLPKYVILTSIEFDHADIYKNLDEVKEAFRMLLRAIPEDGQLVYLQGDKNIESILSEAKCPAQSYGIKTGDYYFDERLSISGRNQFSVYHGGEAIADLALKVFGDHNSLNALGAFALIHSLKERGVIDFDFSCLLNGLSQFTGVKRRQETIYHDTGVDLIEDFAHHPSAVKLTIECMREQFPERRILAVFEPRSATAKRKVFQKAFGEALAIADRVFLAEPTNLEKIPLDDRFSVSEVLSLFASKGVPVDTGKSGKALAEKIMARFEEGDVILIMSNGAFDGIYSILKQGLVDRTL